MSNDNITKLLGDYLLQGWVMTDETCPNEGCFVPLMRSGRGKVPPTTFCVRCDGGPNDPSSSNNTTPADLKPSSVSGSSASDHMNTTTRSSTPLTELSSDPDLPAENFQPIPTEQARRRREQSDRASAEIGNRLLKGWALLMDECPNGSCHGIPLVRPPSSGPRKDPRKECVICGTVYLSQGDVGVVTTPANDQRVQQTTSQNAGQKPAQEHSHTISDIPVQNPHQRSPDVSALNESAKSLEYTLRALSQKLAAVSSNPDMLDLVEIKNCAETMDSVLQTLNNVRRSIYEHEPVA